MPIYALSYSTLKGGPVTQTLSEREKIQSFKNLILQLLE